jgi:hypothetical protein
MGHRVPPGNPGTREDWLLGARLALDWLAEAPYWLSGARLARRSAQVDAASFCFRFKLIVMAQCSRVYAHEGAICSICV